MNFLGAPYPIIRNSRGFLATQDSINQIKSDLIVLLLTNPGERCLTGDTKIPLANGDEIPIQELVGKEPFWVYSYDKETNSILAGRAIAYKTAKDAELMEITLDNNQSVKCTPNHLWLLRDGTYKRADELHEGQSLMPAWVERRKKKNHKILSVKKLNYKEDCYDLHVEKYHNFALSTGCFVHNCMLPDYGTPLRDLLFDQNDDILAQKAKEMIIKSINTWEPRIIINDISTTIGSDSLSVDDAKEDTEHVLRITINFIDPNDLQNIEVLKLEVPLSRGT